MTSSLHHHDIIMTSRCADEYTQGEFTASNSYTIITLVNAVGLTWAMYGLIQFYFAFKIDMAATHPFAKVRHHCTPSPLTQCS